MNRRVIQIVAGFLILVGLSAALLLRVRSNYNLGKPGIKLVDVPIYNERTNIVSQESAFLPATVGEYSSPRVEPVSMAEATILPPDTVYGRRVYTAPDGFQTFVSIVVMGTDRTSIHKPQYCLNGQGESIVQSEIIPIPINKPHPYTLQAQKLTTRSYRRNSAGEMAPISGVFIYWFVADGYLTPHHGERMWLTAKEFITRGHLQRWAYVAYFAHCPVGQEGPLTDRLTKLISESVPEFQLAAGSPATAAALPADDKMASN
jgi:hypothetical protein